MTIHALRLALLIVLYTVGSTLTGDMFLLILGAGALMMLLEHMMYLKGVEHGVWATLTLPQKELDNVRKLAQPESDKPQ